MKEDIKNIEWGKEFKWGIVKRNPLMVEASKRGDRRRALQSHHVVDSSVASFSGSNCVANNLTYDEACALCAILNVGE